MYFGAALRACARLHRVCPSLGRTLPMSILLALHVLFAVIWVGGMFFANQCVRPSIPRLDPTHRVVFLSAVWGRFFLYVLLAIPVMLATGLGMIHEEGG